MPSLVQAKTKNQSAPDVVFTTAGLGKSTRPFNISAKEERISTIKSREAETPLAGYTNEPAMPLMGNNEMSSRPFTVPRREYAGDKGQPSAEETGQPVQMTRKKKNAAKAASVLGGLALAGGIALGSVPLGIIGGLGLLGGAGYLAYKHFTKPSAEERIGRWKSRGEARKARGRFETGRYDTSTGPVTVSGLNRQRISQARKEDYGGETFGGMPPYSKIKSAMIPESGRALYDSSPDLPEMDEKQRLATSLGTTLTNVSEADKAPGIDKFIRAQAHRYEADPTAPHPLDPSVNPAVSTAAKARQVMSGQIPLTADQRRGIDEYASDSSDEEEEPYAIRKGLLKKRV